MEYEAGTRLSGVLKIREHFVPPEMDNSAGMENVPEQHNAIQLLNQVLKN